jgi:hypothetical protein
LFSGGFGDSQPPADTGQSSHQGRRVTGR